MAMALKPGTQTAADELRTVLAQSEDRLVKLSGREAAAELYSGMDRLAELWPAIKEIGVDVRGEWTRWESLQAHLKTRGAKVLAAWGGSVALEHARAAAMPDASHWWWWLDEWVAQERRRRLLRTGGILATVIAVAAIGLFLFNRLFPVDERLREVYTLRTNAEAAIITGDYEQAINSMKRAVTIMPEDPSLQIMYGVLADLRGDSITASKAWDTGRALLQGKDSEFLVQRGMAYGQTNQFEKSAEDELAAIALDPNSARAYLYLGAAYEGQNKITEALDAFTKASDLSSATDPELTVMARTRMASLLQKAPIAFPTGASP